MSCRMQLIGFIGQVVIYDVHGKIVRNFLLLDVITAVQIVECHFWGNGVVALTSDMQLHVAEVMCNVVPCCNKLFVGFWRGRRHL